MTDINMTIKFTIGEHGATAHLFEPCVHIGDSKRFEISFPALTGIGNGLHINKRGCNHASSKDQPLILWGTTCELTIPPLFAIMIDRARLWRLPVNNVLLGAICEARITIINMRGRDCAFVQAIRFASVKPAPQAVEWLENVINDKKSWFQS